MICAVAREEKDNLEAKSLDAAVIDGEATQGGVAGVVPLLHGKLRLKRRTVIGNRQKQEAAGREQGREKES